MTEESKLKIMGIKATFRLPFRGGVPVIIGVAFTKNEFYIGLGFIVITISKI